MTDEAPRGTLSERLGQSIDQFEPFEALRLLEIADPARTPAIRSALTNAYVASPLRKAANGRDIEAAFVGLLGPLGVLPPFYTETALHEHKRRSHGMRAFLDLFLGRLIPFFLRAFEKYRLPSAVTQHGEAGAAPLATALYALIGLGLPALRGRLETDDARLLPYAGLLASHIRSAAGLEVLLADHMGLPVRVEPLRRRWLDIEPHEQTRLGADGGFARLGVDAVAGARTVDVSSAFRVVIGPVDYGTFQWLAPGSATMARLVELVRFYVDPSLEFDVQVILRKEDVPEAQLGAAAPRLGWNAWVRQLPALRDADQAIFDPGTN